MTEAYALLLQVATVSTPAPVVVQNFPGPDWTATTSLFISLVALLISGVAAYFAFWDFRLATQQFQRAELTVTKVGESRDADPIGDINPQGGATVRLALQLNNDGRRTAIGCYVAVWLPRENKMDWNGSSVGWEYGGTPPPDNKADDYQRIEHFVKNPVYVDHPVLLPTINIFSGTGKTDFSVYWQLFHEWGKTPEAMPEIIKVQIL